uniref:Ferroptosis suppressor protein 1 n=1 Tax=Oryzias latipes TaxID=8090 RepID=A0A3P9H3V6_ORYLA
MGGQVSIPEGVHVVVVGGGFAGIAAARQLKSRGVPFTLIDMKEAFHHNLAALRASVQPFAQRTFIPFAKTFGSSFVQGRVEHVDPEQQAVFLQGGREIQYSHLILCTGTSGTFPGKVNAVSSLEASVQKYEELVEQIQAADSVLVIGGGSTGVEMAAEIKTEYQEKKVVLINSRIGLADPVMMPSIRQQVKEVLLEKGVELLLADSGALRVNQYLQVHGFSNIFAVGDCSDTQKPKTAYLAGLQAAVAVTNILNSLRGAELKVYSANVTMLLAIGRNDGVGQFNGYRLPRFLVTLGKSRDLLLWKSWKEMQQTQP